MVRNGRTIGWGDGWQPETQAGDLIDVLNAIGRSQPSTKHAVIDPESPSVVPPAV